jgi:hypothetical protein
MHFMQHYCFIACLPLLLHLTINLSTCTLISIGYLVSIFPIYLLLDFKFGHFRNPLVFYSKWIFFSPLVTNVRLSNLVPQTKNGSSCLLQEVQPEQLKSMLDSQALHSRSQCSARQAERDANIKNAEALGYDLYLGGFPFQL